MTRSDIGFCAAVLVFAGSLAADAENVRGLVGSNLTVGGRQTTVGRPDVSINLMSGYPDHLAQVGSTLTDQSGFYYFYNLNPGRYMLVIANHYYRVVDVQPRAANVPASQPQDVGPIIIN